MKGKRGDHRPHDKSAKVKRTFKKNAPLDPEADVDNPARQEKLIDTPEQEKPVVHGNYCVANFIQPHLSRDKDDKAFIAFEISFPLTDEHKENKRLPARIIEAWDALTKHGFPRLFVGEVPAQTVELALAPDAIEKSTCLKIPFAEITNANISVVEQKGEGKSKDITRLSFRAKTELDIDNWRFAKAHFAHTVWVKMERSQGTLLEEESD
jgi:hypothetical protein